MACALAAGTIAAAPAAAAEPLPFSTLTPDDGAVITQTASPAGVQWYLTGGPNDAYYIVVRVSSTPDVGSDGQTLSDLHQLDDFLLGKSSTDIGVFRGVSHGGAAAWPNYPGTYYWQASANWGDPSPPYALHTALGPIRRITVAAPQPPAAPPAPPSTPPNPLLMTPSMARYFVRATIRRHTSR